MPPHPQGHAGVTALGAASSGPHFLHLYVGGTPIWLGARAESMGQTWGVTSMAQPLSASPSLCLLLFPCLSLSLSCPFLCLFLPLCLFFCLPTVSLFLSLSLCLFPLSLHLSPLSVSLISLCLCMTLPVFLFLLLSPSVYSSLSWVN